MGVLFLPPPPPPRAARDPPPPPTPPPPPPPASAAEPPREGDPGGTEQCAVMLPQALSDGGACDTSAHKAAAAPYAPDHSAATQLGPAQPSTAAPAAAQSLGCVHCPDRQDDGVDSTRSAFGEHGPRPAVGDTHVVPPSQASCVLQVGEPLMIAPELTPQHAPLSSLDGDGSATDHEPSEPSPLAAFGSPVHVHAQCLRQPATAAEDHAAGWLCERTDGAAVAPRGGGQQHSKPRWRGSSTLPRPLAPGFAGNKENDGTLTPALQVEHACVEPSGPCLCLGTSVQATASMSAPVCYAPGLTLFPNVRGGATPTLPDTNPSPCLPEQTGMVTTLRMSMLLWSVFPLLRRRAASSSRRPRWVSAQGLWSRVAARAAPRAAPRASWGSPTP